MVTRRPGGTHLPVWERHGKARWGETSNGFYCVRTRGRGKVGAGVEKDAVLVRVEEERSYTLVEVPRKKGDPETKLSPSDRNMGLFKKYGLGCSTLCLCRQLEKLRAHASERETRGLPRRRGRRAQRGPHVVPRPSMYPPAFRPLLTPKSGRVLQSKLPLVRASRGGGGGRATCQIQGPSKASFSSSFPPR